MAIAFRRCFEVDRGERWQSTTLLVHRLFRRGFRKGNIYQRAELSSDRRSEISSDRVEDAGTHLKVGDTVETMVLNIDRKARGIQLSIKAKDNVETKEAMKQMTTASESNIASGTTSLGALLKAKLDNKS